MYQHTRICKFQDYSPHTNKLPILRKQIIGYFHTVIDLKNCLLLEQVIKLLTKRSCKKKKKKQQQKKKVVGIEKKFF